MRGVAYIILTEKKKIQYVKLRNSAAIFNHSTKLAESNKRFSPFACIATIYGKNRNNNIELFRTFCLDTTGICSWIIVAKVFM